MLLKGLCLPQRSHGIWRVESYQDPSSSAVVPFGPRSPEHKGGLPVVQGQALLRDFRALGMFFSPAEPALTPESLGRCLDAKHSDSETPNT